MELEWDEAKRQETLKERGLDFADALELDMRTAITVEDQRQEYGEPRFVSTGFFRNRLCVLCYTFRDGRMRIISFRKANDREKRDYGKVTAR